MRGTQREARAQTAPGLASAFRAAPASPVLLDTGWELSEPPLPKSGVGGCAAPLQGAGGRVSWAKCWPSARVAREAGGPGKAEGKEGLGTGTGFADRSVRNLDKTRVMLATGLCLLECGKMW